MVKLQFNFTGKSVVIFRVFFFYLHIAPAFLPSSKILKKKLLHFMILDYDKAAFVPAV